jgi:uncharacterized membrane protein YhaH (DUF805 family)
MFDGIFSVSGRITRASYWGWSFAVSVVAGAVSLVVEANPNLILSLVGIVVVLLCSVVTFLHGVKRMHDVDKSGWYLFVPIYGAALAYLVDGTVGDNRFGSDPKGRGARTSSASLEVAGVTDTPCGQPVTPLMAAIADNQSVDAIATLLRASSNVDERGADGGTALSVAAGSHRNPEVITALLGAGADIEARNDDGETVLMIAAASNPNPEVISVLLSAGADIEAKDKSGGTPLMFAAEFNENPEVIISLLGAGADARAKDDAAKSALDYAQGNSRVNTSKAYRMLKRASR